MLLAVSGAGYVALSSAKPKPEPMTEYSAIRLIRACQVYNIDTISQPGYVYLMVNREAIKRAGDIAPSVPSIAPLDSWDNLLAEVKTVQAECANR